MQIIPIQDIPAQTISTALANQACDINLYVKSTGMYCDLRVNGVLIVSGVICQNLNRIVRDKYLGFVGDLMLNDTQGTNDPTSPMLGTRYELIYLESFEVA
jgi:hypothetical protein